MPIYMDSAVRVLHMYELYQRLKSTDCACDGMQFGAGTNHLPALEQAPDKTVPVIGVSYRLMSRLALVGKHGGTGQMVFCPVLFEDRRGPRGLAGGHASTTREFFLHGRSQDQAQTRVCQVRAHNFVDQTTDGSVNENDAYVSSWRGLHDGGSSG